MFCSKCYSSEHSNRQCNRKHQSIEVLEQEVANIYAVVCKKIPRSLFGNKKDEYGPYFANLTKKRMIGKQTTLSEELQPPRYVFSQEIEEKFTPVLIKSLDILSSSPEEIRQRLWATVKNIKLIKSTNPNNIICFPQGSLHTKTFLPSSDIDLVVFNSSINQIYNFLKDKTDHVKNIQRISARVPIIKYYDVETNFQVDVSFNNSAGYANGVRCNNCIKKHPILQPLSILLKKILSFYDCAETFTGGINSTEVFQLSLMFVRLSPNLTLFQYLVNILNFLENTENFFQKVFHPVQLTVTEAPNPTDTLRVVDSKDERIILGKSSRKAEEFAEHARSVLEMIENCDSDTFLQIINNKRCLFKQIIFSDDDDDDDDDDEQNSATIKESVPPNLKNVVFSRNRAALIPLNPENVMISLSQVLADSQDQGLYCYTALIAKTFFFLRQNQAVDSKIRTKRYYLVKLKKNKLKGINMSKQKLVHRFYSNFNDFKKIFEAVSDIDEIK